MLNELMKAFEIYNAKQSAENKLDWHLDVLDNIEDVEDEQEIQSVIKQLTA